MPQWCDVHKMHTIDERCPGCDQEYIGKEELIRKCDKLQVDRRALLAEVESLRAENDRLRSQVEQQLRDWADECDKLKEAKAYLNGLLHNVYADRDAVRAENEALKSKIE